MKNVGHQLDNLFNEVPPDLKRTILDNISSAISKDDFLQLLHDFSEAFEIWRYVYEYGKVTISTRLHHMADLLGVECKKIDANIPYNTSDQLDPKSGA